MTTKDAHAADVDSKGMVETKYPLPNIIIRRSFEESEKAKAYILELIDFLAIFIKIFASKGYLFWGSLTILLA